MCDSFADPWTEPEVILVQHGFARTAEHFYHWMPALSRKYVVIRRELRGHGGSSYPTPEHAPDYKYDTATILEEIRDTLDQLGVQRIHFLGESTSGMLAMAFAAMYPERVHSIIICSTPTHLPEAGQRFLAFGMESWPEACRQLGSRGWAQRLASAQGTLASSDPAYVQWWVDKVAASDGEGLAGYADFLCQLDARPYIKQVQVPMLILSPMHSAMVTLESMQELAASIPTARLEVIETEGHEIYSSAAEKCQAAVERFLTDIHRQK